MSKSAVPADEATPKTRHSRTITAVAGGAASVVIVAATLWFLHRELAELSVATISRQLRAIPAGSLLAAAACAACGYLVLTLYDVTALRYLGRVLRYRHAAMVSFTSFAVAHSVGIATLSGGSIRYRMYSLAGLTAADITRLVLFVSLTFLLGVTSLLGIALLAVPASQSTAIEILPGTMRAAGLPLLLVPAAYVCTALRKRRAGCRASRRRLSAHWCSWQALCCSCQARARRWIRDWRRSRALFRYPR